MRKLLITGGAGFIGSNFVRHWCSRHPEDRLVVLDSFTYAGNRRNLEDLERSRQVHIVVGSILDEELVDSVMEREDVDTVVHFAAESHVDRSITEPGTFVETNVLGTHVLLSSAKRRWIDTGLAKTSVRFHHVSTDEVFGSLDPSEPPFHEETPYKPNSPYAASKAAADHLVRAYGHTYGLPITISNCSNNYGPFQFPEKFISLLIVNALDGRPIPIYGDGANVRDWLFVADHCRALESILDAGRIGETYAIGGESEVRNVDLARLICELIDTEFSNRAELKLQFPRAPAARGKETSSLLSFVRDRPGHDRRYAIDPSKARRDLGFSPAESLGSGLSKTVSWYLDNAPWWREVMDGSYRDWIHKQYSRSI